MKYESLIRRVLFNLPPETAHELGIAALRLGIGAAKTDNDAYLEAFGPISRFGLSFKNPLGVAAGFDKNGVVVDQLSSMGFGSVEVGTVTFDPQKGNEKPRLFRLPDDKALINRLGFNNEGAERIAKRLKTIERQCVVGVNIGRNKDVTNEAAVRNYLQTFEIVHPVADYIAINVSSPNTPNLRELQSTDNLGLLINALQTRNVELSRKPLLLKIAPDLEDVDIEAIVDICLRLQVDGIIATNSTVSRYGLRTAYVRRFGSGGLSGKPLAARSNHVISQIYRHSYGALPIIGVGGIFSGEDAFEKIAAGASLLQAYTGFIYSGPSFARRVLSGLALIVKERGFGSLDEAVGSSVH